MKERKTLLYLVILSMFFLSMLTLLASAKTSEIKAKSSAVYSPDIRSFLYQSNMNVKLPMASTTKIVTALVALETIDPNKVITISKDSVGIEGSSLYLEEGDKIAALDLVYAVLLQSANDAAVALAIEISGSIDEFAIQMNERIREIGVENTNFTNPHGLDNENHYTTAHDLALIAAEALKNETFKKIVSTYKYSFNIGDKTRTVVNHNKLLKMYDECIGVKTGFTRKSGRCLVSAAERDGITLIAVTLDDPNDWNDHTSLLNDGFDSLEFLDIRDVVAIPERIPTISTDGKSVELTLNRDTVIRRIDEKYKVFLDLPPYITRDVSKGEKIGTVKILFEDREENIGILAKSDIKIKTTTKRFI